MKVYICHFLIWKCSFVWLKFLKGNNPTLVPQFRLRPLPAMGVDRSSIPENFCFAEVRDQLKTDTPEIEEIRQEVQRLWVSESVVDTVDLREVPPDARNTYPVEEPFLGDVTPMLNVSRESLEIRQIESSVTEDLPDCLINVQREEMEMVFLGTGSSQPSKYRNVSAIFINLFSRGCVLLDCGEGTYGQLKRRYRTPLAKFSELSGFCC